jgi:uroporphyrinogen decarboxylase
MVPSQAARPIGGARAPVIARSREMDSRDRVLTALDHREPDRVPFDIGSTVVTGIHEKPYGGLRRLLGLPESAVAAHPLYFFVVPEDDIKAAMGIDAASVATGAAAGFEIKPEPHDDLIWVRDEFGIGFAMIPGGTEYDPIGYPLGGAVSLDDVARYPWPDPLDAARYVGFREACERIVNDEARAVVCEGSLGGTMEIATWMRGFEDFYTDLAADPGVVCAMMDRVLEYKLARWGRVFEIAGDLVDVVVEADDLGGQLGPLISPETYRRYIKPRHQILFDFIHSRSRAKILMHSCGAVRQFIPDLIDVGIDILNPVQVTAAGMDSAGLKRDFGRDLTFWGGGVDSQHVLVRGTTAQVRDDVRRRLDDFMPGGGFVFAAVHEIQIDVPPENLLTMWETVRDYGGYRS